MTVGATPVEKAATSGRVVASVGRVTLVTEPRHAHLEQVIIDRAVGLVAIGATFSNRRVFKKKRAAPFRMTGVAVLVDTDLLELRRVRRSVGVMAIRTCNLSFPQRHVGRPHQLRFSL